jgi:double zinc ribbon protein
VADDLDRLFERLVTIIARESAAHLGASFSASEVYERFVPYRSNRSQLKLATHQDYEMTVLRFLAGERGYANLEPQDIRDAFQRELKEPNPDTAYFRNFPDARITINRMAAERILRAERAYAPPTTTPEEEEPASWTGENPVPPSPFPLPLSHKASGPGANQCPYCGGSLPAGRKLNFCPHCGQPPSGELRCPACGTEVDVGWAYCVSCGRSTGFE